MRVSMLVLLLVAALLQSTAPSIRTVGKGPMSAIEEPRQVTVRSAAEWGTLWNLAFPLTRPALVTVSIYDGLMVWNNFLLPLVLTQSPDKRTLPLALWTFQGQYGINVPAVLASVLLTALPILILYAVGRRQLLSGLTAGFGK